MATHIPASRRTEGDGMENTAASILDQNISIDEKVENAWRDPLQGLSERLSNIDIKPRLSAKEAMQSKKLIYLKPIFVSNKTKNTLRVHINTKEPKFVPFEPYKGAVRPIVPKRKLTLKKKILVTTRNRNESFSSDYKSETEAKRDTSVGESSDSVKQLEAELKRLKQENVDLEKQLNYQVQVNGELKHLLVAAVGEDMETRVHSLTEDKLHLAQALLNSAKTLSTHQEQVEWLASQCEVWRSKFLASSVMVEELAGWKASLSQKINETHDIIKNLLEERKCVRRSAINVYSNLVVLRDNFDLLNRRATIKSSNIVDLSSESAKLSDGLAVQLLGSNKKTPVNSALNDLPHLTEAEKAADFMLKNPHPMQLIGDPDAACNAVMGAAVALSGQLYHRSHPPRISCCPQCTGKIHLV